MTVGFSKSAVRTGAPLAMGLSSEWDRVGLRFGGSAKYFDPPTEGGGGLSFGIWTAAELDCRGYEALCIWALMRATP